MEKESQLPFLPDKAPHFFVRVAFDLVPEVSYKNLVHLSQLAEETGHKKEYDALVDSLIKIQWAKFAGLEAIIVEKRILDQASEDVIPYDFIGQAQHAKALVDFVSNVKSALDSLAVFLNTLFNLGIKSGGCDFRRPDFLNQVSKADAVIGDHMKSLENWLDKNRDNSDSIIATRDQWLHRKAPFVTAMFPPIDIGYLPIPKKLEKDSLRKDSPNSSEHYWKTPEFIDFHFKKLTELFGVIVTRCIELEQLKVSKSFQPDLSAVHPISFFPMKATRDTTLRQIRMRKWNPIFFNADTLLEELPHKILKVLTKQEADCFAKLAENRTFIANKQDHYFILGSDNFLKETVGIRKEDIDILEQIGLIDAQQLKIINGSILICGYRGWSVSWQDDQERVVEAISLTRLGKELASLIKLKCDNSYIENVISILNANKIDVQLMAISDFKDGNFKYDNLGFYPVR